MSIMSKKFDEYFPKMLLAPGNINFHAKTLDGEPKTFDEKVKTLDGEPKTLDVLPFWHY
jgi:hypothetical protein